MSNNLFQTLQLISEMRIMPLKQAGVLDLIPDKDLTFELNYDLDAYEFGINDSVKAIFDKYFRIH